MVVIIIIYIISFFSTHEVHSSLQTRPAEPEAQS